MNIVRVELTKCPKCGAICVVGSDEDFIELCAHCGTSFKIEDSWEVSNEEYKLLKGKAKEYCERSSWVALVLK
jgi:hypothetical protein